MRTRGVVAALAAASALGAAIVAPAQAAMPHYHNCKPAFRRYDAYVKAKPRVACSLARALEVAQPSNGQRISAWHWRVVVTQDQKTGRWTTRYWRRGVDGHWPAVIVITIPAA